MSIRMIARDYYCLRQEVETLEKKLNETEYKKREKIKDKLRKLKAEQNRLRCMLEGAKEPPAYRKAY